MPCRGDRARARTVVPEPCPRDRAHAWGERGAVAAGHPMLRTPAPGAGHLLLAYLVESGSRTMRTPERERHGAARCGSNAAVPLTPAEKENTRPCVYRCIRCGTGWLATMVEHGDWGVAVHVFLCSHCRYASQPGVPVAVQDGASALPIRVRAATVPVARLTGPGVETLRLEELLMLLGLLPDAPGSAVQCPALVRAGHTAGVSPVLPEDEGREDRRHARGKMTGDVDQQPDIREGRRRLSRVGGSRSRLLTLLLQPAGTVGS